MLAGYKLYIYFNNPVQQVLNQENEGNLLPILENQEFLAYISFPRFSRPHYSRSYCQLRSFISCYAVH